MTFDLTSKALMMMGTVGRPFGAVLSQECTTIEWTGQRVNAPGPGHHLDERQRHGEQ